MNISEAVEQLLKLKACRQSMIDNDVDPHYNDEIEKDILAIDVAVTVILKNGSN